MKRSKEFRSIITAPPGTMLVEFDASGQEYRWMAVASNDPTMRQLCMPGEDPHAFMGAAISGSDYRAVQKGAGLGDPDAKNKRQGGKVANLSLQYRTSAYRLQTVARVQYGVTMSGGEAERVKSTYIKTYSRIPIYWQNQIHLSKQRGWVETLAGRRVQLVGNWAGEMKWSMESTAINYRIQGTGADQKYLALAMLRPYLRQIGARFAWDLHDGIYFYVPIPRVPEAVAHMQHVLDTLPYRRAWGFSMPIPMPWDCKIGFSWGTLQEYSNEHYQDLLSQRQDRTTV
jgi:DNA polymerase-1